MQDLNGEGELIPKPWIIDIDGTAYTIYEAEDCGFFAEVRSQTGVLGG